MVHTTSIAVAVKLGGPDPNTNSKLYDVIQKAKQNNMPNDNITRSIKKAMGETTDQSYDAITYEGYGPHGVAVFVDTLTDNTTRTVADVRSIFNKFNGNMGTTGSLSFLFDHKCVFTFKKKADMDMDDFILEMIDYGIDEDYDEEYDEENGLSRKVIHHISAEQSYDKCHECIARKDKSDCIL